jgi:hypothetical protein
VDSKALLYNETKTRLLGVVATTICVNRSQLGLTQLRHAPFQESTNNLCPQAGCPSRIRVIPPIGAFGVIVAHQQKQRLQLILRRDHTDSDPVAGAAPSIEAPKTPSIGRREGNDDREVHQGSKMSVRASE